MKTLSVRLIVILLGLRVVGQLSDQVLNSWPAHVRALRVSQGDYDLNRAPGRQSSPVNCFN